MSLRISLMQQLKQHKAETWYLRFSSDGKRLISSDGEALYLWGSNESGTWKYERSFPFRNATFPYFVADNKMLAFRNQENLIQLISFDGKEITTFPFSSQANFAFSPDQHWLVSGDTARNVLLWDLYTYNCFVIPIPFPAFRDYSKDNETDISDETANYFCFTPDGQRLVFGASSQEGYVQICHIDPSQKLLLHQRTLLPHGIIGQSIAPNGRMLAIARPEEIYVYDLESLQLLQTFPRISGVLYDLLAFSPDSQFLMASRDDGIVDIWSLLSFECVASFAAHPGVVSHWTNPIGGLDWSRMGNIVTGGAGSFEEDMLLDDYTIKIWKVEE